MSPPLLDRDRLRTVLDAAPPMTWNSVPLAGSSIAAEMETTLPDCSALRGCLLLEVTNPSRLATARFPASQMQKCSFSSCVKISRPLFDVPLVGRGGGAKVDRRAHMLGRTSVRKPLVRVQRRSQILQCPCSARKLGEKKPCSPGRETCQMMTDACRNLPVASVLGPSSKKQTSPPKSAQNTRQQHSEAPSTWSEGHSEGLETCLPPSSGFSFTRLCVYIEERHL